MIELTLPLTASTERARFRFPVIAVTDRRAALVLLLAVLGYGLAMLLASGVPIARLAAVSLAYLPMTAGTAAVVALLYAATMPLSATQRRNWPTALFWLMIAATMEWLSFPFFGMFKQVVLPERGFIWDARFAHLGRTLLGVSPWTLTHRVFGTVAGTRFLDSLYSLWMPLVFVTPLVAAVLCTNSAHRFRILASWFLAWALIGSLAAWVFASAGPCYYNTFIGPDPSYAELQRRLAEIARQAAAQGTPITAIEFQPILLNVYRSGGFGLGGGISAMPSMHVTMASLLAIIGWKRNAAWGLFATTFALLIWVGSVHFGWHYFVDGPVGTLMIAAIWQGTTILGRRLYPDEQHAGTPSTQKVKSVALVDLAGDPLGAVDLGRTGIERTRLVPHPLAPEQDQCCHQCRA